MLVGFYCLYASLKDFFKIWEKLLRFHFLLGFQANRHIWLSLMQTLSANLQCTKESAPEMKFILLLDRLHGFEQFFMFRPLVHLRWTD